ncbi:MAG TPA: hypothetical protein VHW09_26325 [Bryobacteraceae bacterium]|nr:hypothetical protein [Bryobacteraceae bacterium]
MRSANATPVKPLLLSTLMLAYCAVALPAATLERLSLDDLITKSTSIVRGKVLNSYTATDGPVIYTHYRIQTSETLKGSARGVVEFQLPGGTASRLRQSFAGVPTFQPGDEFVFFLWTGRSGTSQVLGLTQGLFSVAPGGAADPLTTRPASHEVMLDHGTGKQVTDRTLTMRLSALRTRIQTTLSGAVGAVQ